MTQVIDLDDIRRKRFQKKTLELLSECKELENVFLRNELNFDSQYETMMENHIAHGRNFITNVMPKDVFSYLNELREEGWEDLTVEKQAFNQYGNPLDNHYSIFGKKWDQKVLSFDDILLKMWFAKKIIKNF